MDDDDIKRATLLYSKLGRAVLWLLEQQGQNCAKCCSQCQLPSIGKTMVMTASKKSTAARARSLVIELSPKCAGFRKEMEKGGRRWKKVENE